jgi:hypothetical protein
MIANGPWEAADPEARGIGQVINRTRMTNCWVGSPAVARPYACGLTHIELHGAPTAATGIDARSSVVLKPFPARPFEESSP